MPNPDSILAAAREEAASMGHGYVDTGHLLLGLLRDRNTLEILKALGADAEGVSADVRRGIRVGRAPASLTTRPITSRVKRALGRARDVASMLGEGDVEAQHVLLGLLIEGHGSGMVLRDHGVTSDAVEAYLRGRNRNDQAP